MGSARTVVAAVPDVAALASFGDQCPRSAVNVGVGVWVIVPVLRGKGRYSSRAPRRCGVPLVWRVGPLVVTTSVV